MLYLKLWIKGEEEGLSGAIKAIADLKGLGCQRTKHLKLLKKTKQQQQKGDQYHNNVPLWLAS